LEQIKEKEVAMENFDEAKQIKDGIDKLRNIGTHLTKLDERKRMASMNEDYDAAKILKHEIDKLRQNAFNPWLEELIKQHTAPH
jgi:centrosomal protein CEP104